MISKKQLEEWEKQNAKDIQQYKKDEIYLKQMEAGEDRKVRSFFSKLRSKYLSFDSQEHHKLNRLLQEADISKQIQDYPNVVNTYIAYNTAFIVSLGICVFAPKKLVSKILSSLIVFGLKTNIGDGLFTYYSMKEIALGNKMTQGEQQIRNILQFYYMSNRFNGKPMSEQQKEQSTDLLKKIKAQNEKYINFKKIQSMV